MPSRLLTVVFTDIKGFTTRTAQADREFVTKLLHKHDELLKPIIKNYEGTLIKKIGDAFLLSFESPTNAVLCSLMMQETLRTYNLKATEKEVIEIRVAINTGEVNTIDGDILGDVVNVASRVEGITEANEIWFTEATYLAMNKQEVPTCLVGEFRLKGVPEAVKVYKVIQDEKSELYQKAREVGKSRLSSPALPATTTGETTGKPPLAHLLFFIGVVCFVLTAWLTAGPPITIELDAAREAKKTGKFNEAFLKLSEAFKRVPDNKQMRALVTETIAEAIEDRLKRNELEKAQELYKEQLAKFPFVERVEKSETQLTLAESRILLQNGRSRDIPPLLDDLAKRHANAADTLFEIGVFCEKTGFSYVQTIKFLHAAAAADPGKYASNPVFLSGMDYFLKKVGPETGFPEAREFIADHCFSHFQDLLQKGLYEPGEDNRELRWNAKIILEKHQTRIDLPKFYLLEIMDCHGKVSPLYLEALEYFLASSTRIATISLNVDSCYLFESEAVAADSKLFQAVSGPLYETMRPYLEGGLTSSENPKNFHLRGNAYKAISLNRELSDAERWNFHVLNLENWDRGLDRFDMRSPINASMNYLGSNPVPIKEILAGAESKEEALKKMAAIRDSISKLVKNQLPKNIEATNDPGYERVNELWRSMLKNGESALNNLQLALGEKLESR